LHWQLIAGINWFLSPENWPIILEVAIGIGMVIFVHELGHFAVAKACGVKCEKFYLGFDIGGWKLFKYQWGETEYGIGVLPLGGYVKMLGQDDNPSRLQEETERAKLKAAEGETVEGDSIFDPRSYLAKSVPQRMAIISAGVIMNVIFAFVVGSIAYGLGVEQVACVVGKVFAGEGAWEAGLQEGDRVVQIGDVKNPVFRDLQTGVALGDNIDKGVEFVVKRPGVDEPLHLKVYPRRRKLVPLIGMTNGDTCEIGGVDTKRYRDVAPNLAVLMPGDEIVAIDGEPVSEGWQVEKRLSENERPMFFTVQRTIRDEAKPDEAPKHMRLDVMLPAIPMRTVGLIMAIGKVTAVQQGSPADNAGIRADDVLKSIDGADPGDPMTLARRLRARQDAAASVTIERKGQILTMQLNLDLTAVDNTLPDPTINAESTPVAVPALGIAIEVENRVAKVESGSSASATGIKPGDEIVKARFIPPSAEIQREKYGMKNPDETPEELDFDGKRIWPILVAALQGQLSETQLELTMKDGRVAKLQSDAAADWFNSYRGFRLAPVIVIQKAETATEAVELGARETKYSLSLVFRFLRKLMSGQVSVKGIGGPVEIARQAGATASAGMSPFLLFLGMLSANLAVLNFLPIPMLDGGHMVFLAAEGVRGKPVSERIVACFQFAGLFLLASLMIFVLLLDVGLIPRG
jgi:regulator of sigma E protease